MNKNSLIIILIILNVGVKAQCPIASFTTPMDACLEANIPLDNVNISGDHYEWDFCGQDLASTPTTTRLNRLTMGNNISGLKLVETPEGWFGFVASGNNNKLIRLTFGSSLDNTPTVEDLGNISGLFKTPESIDLIKSGNSWYGLVANLNESSVIRLDFGSLLSNMPSGDKISIDPSYSLSFASSIKLIFDGINYYSFVANRGGNDILRLYFGTSMTNVPDVDALGISGLSSPRGLYFVQNCDGWHLFLLSTSGNKLHRVSFSDLGSAPSASTLGTTGDVLDGIRTLVVHRDFGIYYLVITSNDGDLYRVEIGEDVTSSSVVVENLTNFSILPFTLAFDLKRVKGQFLGYGIGNDNYIYKYKFEEICPIDSDYIQDSTPISYTYLEDGEFGIELYATNDNGPFIDMVQQVTVSPSTAPDIDFTPSLPISCVNNAIDFTAINSSGDVQSYDWDFGDGDTSTDQDPTHQFAAPGTYDVKLSVTAANTCDNFIEKSITIYEEPVGAFDSPTGVICTNQLITFTNTTPDNFEGNETFEWMVDGMSVSTDRDLDYDFDTGGNYEIKLITSIPGCSQETVDNVNIIAGPAPNFTVTDNCVGTLFEFKNTTTGSNIVSYEWDFDNGFMSSEENPPPFEYSEAGTYNVTLATTNASGCVTSIEKSLTVYDLPKVKFTNELSCEGAVTQFADSSTVSDANIEAWQWNFDDPGSGDNISTAQNAMHTFSSDGAFDVKLITASTFGCIDSTGQVVEVKTAPEADFTYDKICLAEEVNFQDASLPVPGEELTSWAWNIGGEFSDKQNPTASLDFPIDYNVSLTVTSQNLCSNTVEKTITVNPTPEINFEVENACDNQAIHFYGVTVPAGDPIVSRSWDFDGLGNAADSSVYFNFAEAGNYNITLAIITEGGCEYFMQKMITVNEAPKANFVISSSYGAPPFTVEFTDQSSSAVAYSWDFADGNTSVESNPVNTFQDEGTYEVTLAIQDANGCADTTSAVVNALIPNLDIELQQLTVVGDQLVLTIINNGTIAIDSLLATVNLGDEIVLEEVVKQSLLPSANPKAVNHTLSLKLIDNNVDYICVTLTSFLVDIEDSDPINNAKCKNTDAPVVFVRPFPNPVRDVLNVVVVSERTGSGTIKLTNSIGETIREVTFDGVKGRNQIEVNTSNIKGGLYLIQVEMAGSTFTSRVAIDN